MMESKYRAQCGTTDQHYTYCLHHPKHYGNYSASSQTVSDFSYSSCYNAPCVYNDIYNNNNLKKYCSYSVFTLLRLRMSHQYGCYWHWHSPLSINIQILAMCWNPENIQANKQISLKWNMYTTHWHVIRHMTYFCVENKNISNAPGDQEHFEEFRNLIFRC